MKPDKKPTHLDSLPEGYRQTAEFRIKNNTRAMLALNGIGFVLFLLAAPLIQLYSLRTRGGPADLIFSFQVDNLAQVGQFVLIMLLDVAILIFLHEGLHGLCFWVITKKKPIFMIGPGYAAASSPDTYFARVPYLITALCPLVVMTAAGLLLIPVVPPAVLFHVNFITVFNIAGAVGDLWVSAGILSKHGDLLVRDELDRVTLFQFVN